MTNGCGLFGELSKVWKLFSGSFPPFSLCCDEHDLAYEQVNSEEDRLWADVQFLRCMNANAYPKAGYICFSIIRLFGWLALLPKRIAKLLQTT